MGRSKIDWEAFAQAYKNAQTEEEKDKIFEAIREAIAIDAPEWSDETEGAISFLRSQGVWHD